MLDIMSQEENWFKVAINNTSTYSNLLDLCKAADVFFPEFFVLAEDFPTQCRRLLELFLSNQVAEILQADSLHDTTSIYPSAENPCLIFKPTFNFKKIDRIITYLLSTYSVSIMHKKDGHLTCVFLQRLTMLRGSLHRFLQQTNINPLKPTVATERQSARMSKITNDGLTRSGTGCFIAVPIWQQ